MPLPTPGQLAYATNRAAHLQMARHYDQHRHCPGFDPGRYHRDLDYRCPHCEGTTAPPVRSQWRAMAQPQAEDAPHG